MAFCLNRIDRFSQHFMLRSSAAYISSDFTAYLSTHTRHASTVVSLLLWIFLRPLLPAATEQMVLHETRLQG